MTNRHGVRESDIYKALSSSSRLKMLKFLYEKASSVDDIAGKADLSPITARHHLRILERAGLIESYEVKGPVGKPKLFYKVSKEPSFITFPKRGYLALSDSLIGKLGTFVGERRGKEILRGIGREVGRETIRALGSQHAIKAWSLEAFKIAFVDGHLSAQGAEQEIVQTGKRKLVYRIHNCPFLEVALKYPEAVCDVLEDGFREGLVDGLGGKAEITRLSCIAHNAPYCDFVCEWK